MATTLKYPSLQFKLTTTMMPTPQRRPRQTFNSRPITLSSLCMPPRSVRADTIIHSLTNTTRHTMRFKMWCHQTTATCSQTRRPRLWTSQKWHPLRHNNHTKYQPLRRTRITWATQPCRGTRRSAVSRQLAAHRQCPRPLRWPSRRRRQRLRTRPATAHL